jgi:hypothetical protein
MDSLATRDASRSSADCSAGVSVAGGGVATAHPARQERHARIIGDLAALGFHRPLDAARSRTTSL